MLVNRIVVHALLEWSCLGRIEGGIRIWLLEDDGVDLLEAAKWVNWATISLGSLEKVFSPWVLSLIWVLSWSASSSATGWRVSQFSIRALGMFLLHMSVKCGIGQVSFVAVLAFKVSSSVVVLWPSLTTLFSGIMLVSITTFIWVTTILALIVVLVLLIFHWASLLIEIQAKLYYIWLIL